MTEDTGAGVSSTEPTVSTDASKARQRRKRKWDQPADSLISAGTAVPGVLPFSHAGVVGTVPLPGIAPTSIVNPLAATGVSVTPLLQALSSPQQAPKINQPKIQDELIIAREIVINDAEASVRYKLTRRQTQEEIQKSTGAVVITRGKYRPTNAPLDGEKPLYLHISSGAHLKETAERILAVDCAAAMVEEMLKQVPNVQAMPSISQTPNPVKGTQPLNTCVYLGFDADPSLNIVARIRGPNDQYINHIMNETGATVVLRGRGSGNLDGPNGEELQQPLHLFLSSSNPKGLEDAKRLAENLLDTICMECGASRVSSYKVYGAVPPPQQLLTGAQDSENEHKANAGMGLSMPGITTAHSIASVSVPVATVKCPQGPVRTAGMLNCGQTQTNATNYHQPLSSGRTSYSGYCGIYPEVTPLQQVALALRHSTSPVIPTVTPTVAAASAPAPTVNVSSSQDKEKQPPAPQKRKFQELPVGYKGLAKTDQGSEPLRAKDPASDLFVRNISTMPAPKKLVQPSSYAMPPPPPKFTCPAPLPRNTPPSKSMPPPPPKFASSQPVSESHDSNKILHNNNADKVPDTLVKLMEYGDDDDDSEETKEETSNGNSSAAAVRKPFWAI